MSDCCIAEAQSAEGPHRCPKCDQPGRKVDAITVKALLRPEALATLSARGHRFCSNASCPVVYFAEGEAFSLDAVAVPVFQKQAGTHRTVCYCFQIGEADLRREIRETGGSTASKRVSTHVKAGRCACEIKNPQGSCCLGNLGSAVTAIVAEFTHAKVERGL